MDNTEVLYDSSHIDELKIKYILKEVATSLEELDYDPVKQISSYLQSGDLDYISSYKDSRNKMALLNRQDILELLIKNYL